MGTHRRAHDQHPPVVDLFGIIPRGFIANQFVDEAHFGDALNSKAVGSGGPLCRLLSRDKFE
jgi:hypothetical protein